MAEKPLVVANWKMNCLRAEAAILAGSTIERQAARPAPADLVLCPPFLALPAVAEAARGSGIAVGGQDCHWEKNGAHTGDISAAMLRDAGASYVILGHSERRAGHGESDVLIARKVAAAHRAGLVAILCLGETRAQREAGYTEAIIEKQFVDCLPDSASPANTVIAYEPVWAIGAGVTPGKAEIVSVHAALRALARRRWTKAAGSLRILYGGSVSAANAGSILALKGVDGVLVGGASLNSKDFWAIAGGRPAFASDRVCPVIGQSQGPVRSGL